MVRDSLSSNRFLPRRRPLTASRRGRPPPYGPENLMPDVLGGPHECVTDETTWRQLEVEREDGVCGLHRLENGCCVLQHHRDIQLLEMYKHFLDHPHIPMLAAFEHWLRNLEGLGRVRKATVSMSNPDFLRIPILVSKLESCGTSIDVRVDHTVEGDVVPFKFTKLFLGETSYTGEVARSDLSQSVARTVMDVQNLALEIDHSQYSNPPVAGFDVNPVLAVSLINITPILPMSLTRHVFFHELSTSFINVIGSHHPSGHIISPSSFKYELGKDFQNYLEYIPDGYQRLLPESIGQAAELALEIKNYSDNYEYDRRFIRSTRFETSADSAIVVYDFAYNIHEQRTTYLVKITLWPLVCVETQNVLITGQYVAPTRSV